MLQVLQELLPTDASDSSGIDGTDGSGINGTDGRGISGTDGLCGIDAMRIDPADYGGIGCNSADVHRIDVVCIGVGAGSKGKVWIT